METLQGTDLKISLVVILIVVYGSSQTHSEVHGQCMCGPFFWFILVTLGLINFTLEAQTVSMILFLLELLKQLLKQVCNH